jgi:hypothetical protein
MPLPSSGQISMGDINEELNRSRNTANTSLAGGSTPTAGSLFGLANNTVNKVAPHRISEFYGYAGFFVITTSYSVVNTTTNICTISISVTQTLWTTNSNGIVGVGDIMYILDGGYNPVIGGEGFNFYTYNEGSSRVWVEINPTTGVIISKTYCSSITFTQVFGWYISPCSGQITIYQGSDNLYYSNTSGTIFNGTVYIPIGFNDFGSYDWSEQIINNGNFEDNFIIQSGCTPS